MTKKVEGTSPLVAAAQALELELRRYAVIADSVVKAPLDSQKGIDRASSSIAEAAEAEQRVLDGVKALALAINAVREEQAERGAAVNERAGLVIERRAALDGLLARFEGIGTVVRTLNEAAQKVSGYKPDPYDPEGGSAVDETLAKIEDGMDECARHASEVQAEGGNLGFGDVARQADQLRQQSLSTKNRVALLRKQRAAS
jgi:hypothetical protein